MILRSNNHQYRENRKKNNHFSNNTHVSAFELELLVDNLVIRYSYFKVIFAPFCFYQFHGILFRLRFLLVQLQLNLLKNNTCIYSSIIFTWVR